MPKKIMMMANHTLGLSIRQPWAALVAAGLKVIECRNWRPPAHVPVGTEFYVHAGKAVDEEAERHFTGGLLGNPMVAELPEDIRDARGAIIARARLVGVHRYYSPAAFAMDVGKHLCEPTLFIPSRYGFELRITALMSQPVPCRGQLMFFTLPNDVAEQSARCAGVIIRGAWE